MNINDINIPKIAFHFTLEWNFRDGVPEEWYDMETDEDFKQAFDAMPKMIDDADLIVDETLENEMAQSVANIAWNLYNFTRITFAGALKECE